MNLFHLSKTNRAALFFAMTLLPTGLVYAQSKRDTVQKEKQIEEVVVIGYGTQRKAVTGSVATVKGDAFEKCLRQTLLRLCKAEQRGRYFTNVN
jgi:hypothetical protein